MGESINEQENLRATNTICEYVIERVKEEISRDLGIDILTKESNLRLRGLLAYVNILEYAIKRKCVIRLSRVFEIVTNWCINVEYVKFVLAHEACHCLTAKFTLSLLAATVSATLLYTFLSINNLLLDVAVAFILIRFGLYIRMISEYLADRCVLRIYGLTYIKFLQSLSSLEERFGSSKYRLLLRILNQPTASDRVNMLTKKYYIIRKFLTF